MWRLEKRVDRLIALMASLMQATALLAKSVDTHIETTRVNGAPPAPPEGD